MTDSPVRQCYDVLDLTVLMILLCSRLTFVTSTLTIMPPFMPNKKMLQLHRDKGEKDWEVYAWCLRDAIAKSSGLPKEDNASLRTKNTYCRFYDGTTKEMEIDRVKYTRDMFGTKDAKGIATNDDQEIKEEEEEVPIKRKKSVLDKIKTGSKI